MDYLGAQTNYARLRPRRVLWVLWALLYWVSFSVPAAAAPELHRGVNLGSILDAPGEGAWGEWFSDDFAPVIANAGFDHIRLPVCWSIYTEKLPPYSIAPWILQRVDHILAVCRQAGLAVILDLHNYDELIGEPPPQEKARYLAIWQQIAAHYAAQPDAALLFEPLNEPGLAPEVWSAWLPDVLAVIRQSNPTRTVLIGGSYWEDVAALEQLAWPDDEHLMATIHFYQPFEFTHQGAEWTDAAQALGTEWRATDPAVHEVTAVMQRAQQWTQRTGIAIHVGEFGVYEKADLASRAAWTACVARAAEAHGLSWSYWDFCASFGIYDEQSQTFVPELLQALIP